MQTNRDPFFRVVVLSLIRQSEVRSVFSMFWFNLKSTSSVQEKSWWRKDVWWSKVGRVKRMRWSGKKKGGSEFSFSFNLNCWSSQQNGPISSLHQLIHDLPKRDPIQKGDSWKGMIWITYNRVQFCSLKMCGRKEDVKGRIATEN